MRRLRRSSIVMLVAAASVAAASCSDDGDDAVTPAPQTDAAADATGSGDGGGVADGAPGGDAATAPDAGADAAGDAGSTGDAAIGTMTLTSTAFTAGGAIPAAHACNDHESPPLAWTGAPAGTQSYAIVMRDLTLASQGNYHWVIYDIPASTTSLPQDVPAVASPAAPAGAKQTYWSFSSDYSYLGPCPPMGGGAHQYQFSVYAFATPTIPVPQSTTDPAAADAVIQQNKTASGSLTGTYER